MCEALEGNCPAVNATKHPAALENVKVAADRFGGHIQLLGGSGSIEPAIVARPIDDY